MTFSPPASPSHTDVPGPARPSRPPPHWGRRLSVALAVVLLAVGGVFWGALKTEPGARLLWRATTLLLPDTLSGQFASGTLAGGLELRNLVYRDGKQVVRIDHLKGAWQLTAAPWRLTVRSLQATQVDVRLLPSAPTPLRLPAQLTLPLALVVQDLQVQQVVLHQGLTDSQYTNLRLQGATDGLHHQLTVVQADTPYGRVQGRLHLDGKTPFAVAGSTTLATLYEQQTYRATLDVSGTLQALGLHVQASGGTLAGSADIDATPFAAVPLVRARVALDHLDPRHYHPGAPHADLQIRALLTPLPVTPVAGQDPSGLAGMGVSGPVTVTNSMPGALDQGLLPLLSARAQVLLTAQRQEMTGLQLQLPGTASVTGTGAVQADGSGAFQLQVARLDLHALYGALKPSRLEGPVKVTLARGVQDVTLALRSPGLSVSADVTVAAQQVTLHAARLQAGTSQLRLKGTLRRDEQAQYTLSGVLQDFDPAAVLAQIQAVPARGTHRAAGSAGPAVAARLNMTVEAAGALQPALRMQLAFQSHDSRYNALPMTGSGRMVLSGQRLVSSEINLSVAGNTVHMQGGFGGPADRLVVRIDAPALARLGYGLAGRVQVDGTVAGTVAHPVIDARYQATGVVMGELRLAQLDGEVQVSGKAGTDPHARLKVVLNARGVHSKTMDIETASANVQGTYADHAIAVRLQGQLSAQAVALTLAAHGGLKQGVQGYAWNGVVNTFENRGMPEVSIGHPVTLSVAPDRVVLGSTQLTIGPADIALKGLEYAPGVLRTQGDFRALRMADLLALQQKLSGQSLPVTTSLVVDGHWDIDVADRARGNVTLERRAGDVAVRTPYGENAIGLTAMTVRADLQGRQVTVRAQVDASRIGSVSASASVGLVQGAHGLGMAADSALTARVAARVPSLRTLGALTGPQISLDGSVSLQLTAAGTLDNPQLAGTLNGDKLALTLYDQGVRLRDGTARIVLDNHVIEMREVVFLGGTGSMRVTGRIPLDSTAGNLTALITADRVQLLADPSRQLTLSGQAQIANVSQRLQVNGKFRVDQALISLPDKAAPVLGEDVVVALPAGRSKPASGMGPPVPVPVPAAGPGSGSLLPPKVDLRIDLGDNFRFKGTGADIFLAGELEVRSGPGQPAQAYGTVRIVRGDYEAFGAKLAIERGILSFQGRLDNPSINILAMRRNQSVPAGVEVTGTAQQPRLALVSEPALAEEEKLSWLVFGRAGSASAGQAQGAVQGAALGLLNKFGGARLASSIGLDKVAFGTSENGTSTAQVLSLGKEISKRLFVGYEQGLAGASSVVKLTYTLTQHWSLVARGGAVTGLDVLYSRRYDHLGDDSGPVKFPAR